MKKSILALVLTTALTIAAVAHAETTITKTVDPENGTVTTTTITRNTDTDPRVKTINTEKQFDTYVYSRWDKNGDGYITPDEWNESVTSWYAPGTTVVRTYADWDANHNGKLDPQEFDRVVDQTDLYKTWNVTTTTMPAGATADSSFAAYDLNGDGSITPSEWAQTHK